ncbi:hypothetical protein FA13DRAFT_1704776 [Coprinellus micaceus]|uniref:Uncharacterized protein n=1 Tax=Coprinellus micaceus TaxID=71717 RepID=A0A4Y7TYJ7_COPMI|nr:hypothetical protein FA13DRAFT_1704776 [Coprinellus micaceus]
MSTIRAQNRRRRSHSASSAFSSSSSSPRFAKKVAVKRSHPQATASQWGESSKWDPDNQRRGKRRRRGISAGSDRVSASRIAKFNGFPQVTLRHPNSTFAISSDDFGLPMSNGKKRERPRCSSALSSISFVDVSDTDLRRLRSSAFWELERSVEESGEGFIRKMREHEYLRSGILSEGDRGRPLRPHRSLSSTKSPTHTYEPHSDMSEGDDDEIHIYSGEPASRPGSPDIQMDGQHDSPPFAVHRSFSSSFCSFGFLSADETPSQTSSSPLSSSQSTSPMPESIPKHIPAPHPLFGAPHSTSPKSNVHGRHSLPTSDVSEKDIEALALALANGAGGLNDYAVLHHGDLAGDNQYGWHTGELWH